MSSGHLRNIGLKDYQSFLIHIGCKLIRTNGGHEIYARADLNRPITLQSHIDPVPEFIIRQHLRYFGMNKKEFLEILSTM